MARGSKIVVNRKALNDLQLAAADALFETAKDILEGTRVPDAPPLGQGLIQGGAALAWYGGKKVGGTTIGGRAVNKPRGFSTPPDEATAVVGFGFPGRFVYTGTVDTRAQPFLQPWPFVGNVQRHLRARFRGMNNE